MAFFKKLCKVVDVFNEKAAKLSSWAIILLILTITYEVTMRYLFNSPTVWSYEMSYFLSSFLIMMAMAYTLQIKNHVNIDVIYNKFSRKTQIVLSLIFTILFFFPLWILIIQAMIPSVIKSYTTGERSSYGSWLPVIWPFKAWILMGLIMLLFQGIIEFIRDIIRLYKGENFI